MRSSLRSSRERFHKWSLARISADTTHIKAVQRWRSPLLDATFKTVSLFGKNTKKNDLHQRYYVSLPLYLPLSFPHSPHSFRKKHTHINTHKKHTQADEIAYTLGLPVMCWSSPSIELSTYVIISWALVFYTGHALKDYWQLPRPFKVDPDVVCLEHHFEDEFGLPSTHAQAAWCIPLVWLVFFKPAAMALAVGCYLMYAVSISFSRVYLGVHSLIDVFVGSALGLVIAGLVVLVAPMLRFAVTMPAVAILLPCVALATYPCGKELTTSYRDTASILGVTSGVLLGDWLVSRGLLVTGVPLSFKVLGIRVVLGLLVVVVCHEIAKRIVWAVIVTVSGKNDVKNPRLTIPYKYISYIGIGLVSSALVPLFLFRPLGIPVF